MRLPDLSVQYERRRGKREGINTINESSGDITIVTVVVSRTPTG